MTDFIAWKGKKKIKETGDQRSPGHENENVRAIAEEEEEPCPEG